MELGSAVDVNMRPYSVEMIAADTITICPYPLVVEQPKDYVLWSLCNFSFMNTCCLGFAALVYSIKLYSMRFSSLRVILLESTFTQIPWESEARDCKVAGNAEDATRYGKRAKILNIVAIILGVLSFLLISCLIASVLIALRGRVKILFDEYKKNIGVFGSGSGDVGSGQTSASP